MNRSWFAFVAGLLILLTPLHELWLITGLGPWGPFLAWGLLLILAWWSTREARPGAT